ncbi:MAG: 3' terminal RNA ribose 2'-O-methyltransferase Hen1 [Deltaproteobacteria bacterium]|nr:3' terminal RNA ribose 2'-O-methyltransferase Hen1 [Deltaproteobacteria bacterium]
MILTLTCAGEQAQDFSYLLFKHPLRLNSFPMNFGLAHVFYPEYEQSRVSCSMVLEIDPIPSHRKKGSYYGLFDYVSVRPYASSSFMSVAISRVFGTAMAGNCADKPELVNAKLPLSAFIAAVPCARPDMPERFFAPLGYEVKSSSVLLAPDFPEWGPSPLTDLTISGEQTLSDLLKHLYVLLSAMGGKKHYYIGQAEVDKLLRIGQGWLPTHPARNLITHLFLGQFRAMAKMAMNEMETGDGAAQLDESLLAEAKEADDKAPEEPPEKLYKLRQTAIISELQEAKVKSVLDYGCGEGRLLPRLLRLGQFEKIGGLDVDLEALSRAEQRVERIFHCRPAAAEFYHGALTYLDDRLLGYEAVVCQEVIEHLDLWRLPLFADVVFGQMKPRIILVTTPNFEYNVNYQTLRENAFRHADHCFELDRAAFKAWAEEIAERFGYRLTIKGIGEEKTETGYPTQMGVFEKC